MKKSLIILLAVITEIIFLVNFASAININEVELNPPGSDSGLEWIELYSSNEINLNGWKIINNDNESLELNQSINGYLIINLERQWLDNSDEKISLYDGNELVEETILFSDSDNDNKTWQYCNGWNFTSQTKNSQNLCSSGNQQNNTQQNNTNNQEASISLDMDWNEDDIINGEEFEIELTAKNLGDKKYDIKVWIEDNENVISDRYDEENDEWKSGTYYINNFFVGPGNETNEIKLKIRDDYLDFSGNAKIYFKIRDGQEISKSIKVLEKSEDETAEEDVDDTEETKISHPIKSTSSTGKIIKLGSSNSEETGNIEDERGIADTDLIYESKNEKIKIYSVFGFALLCLGLAILVIFKKIK